MRKKINDSIEELKYMPKAHAIIKKYDSLEMEYRRIVINNYVIIYTVDEENHKVYIVNIYYGRSDYLAKL